MRFCVSVLLIVAIVPCVFADSDATRIVIDPILDSVTAGAGIASVVATELLLAHTEVSTIPTLDPETINPLDRIGIFEYSDTLDTISDMTQYATFIAPALLALGAPTEEWLKMALVYVEAASISWGVKNALKLAVTRYRPYLYGTDVPDTLLDDADNSNSFPSGHATMAFTGASYFTYVYSRYHPGSKLTLPIAIGSYGLAATTAFLRITGGNHFITDVLAGAALGTAIGILVPLLHMQSVDREASHATSLTVTPTAASISIRY